MDSPIDVLPVPGGPMSVRIVAGLAVGLDAALLAELLDGDVLDDAVLDVLEAGVVGVEHLARGDGVEDLVGALAPRHARQPVEVRADHLGLAALLAGALEAPELALGLLAHLVGHAGLVDLRAVLVGDRALVLAQLAADRLHLLAQEVLALLLLGAGLDVVADLAAHLHLRQALALELEAEREARGDVELLEQADLLLERQVGGVAAGVGQRAGVDDRAQELRHAAVVAAQLEDLLDHRAVVGLELARAAVGRHVVVVLFDLDAQAAARVGLGGADDAAAGAALELRAAPAAGQADDLGDVGDRADLGEVVVVTGDEEHLLLTRDVDGKRDVHRREDDGVVEGYEEERLGHAKTFEQVEGCGEQ